MPWTCDATLPTAERYASLKFRRFARRFDVSRIDYEDAAELVAFMLVVPERWAKWIFHWDLEGRAAARALFEHMKDRPETLAMMDQNLAQQDYADGIAVLGAMRDGGFNKGGLPPICRMAVRELQDQGLSYAKIARKLGLTFDQVRIAVEGTRPRGPSRASASAAALLAVG